VLIHELVEIAAPPPVTIPRTVVLGRDRLKAEILRRGYTAVIVAVQIDLHLGFGLRLLNL
jgi:hypothetical protein